MAKIKTKKSSTKRPTKSLAKAKNNKKKLVQVINKTKVLPLKARKVAVSAVSMLDERILNLASDQYNRVVKEIARRKNQLDNESRVALELGERILTRAKEVRSSMSIFGQRSRRG